MTTEALPLATRLKRGAQMLGALWRSKQRCVMGWAVLTDEKTLVLCDCEKPTRFCMAKKQWVVLAMTERELVNDEHGVVLMMNASEWDETGLLLKIEVEGQGEIKVGNASDEKKRGQMKMVDLAAIASDPESGKKMLGLLKAFPGSKVQAVTA